MNSTSDGIDIRALAQKEVEAVIAARLYDKAEYANSDMSGIYAGKFVSDRIPGWHDLGVVKGSDIESAREGLTLVGPYTVRSYPLVTPDGNQIPRVGLFREDMDGGNRLFFNTVSTDYSLINPQDFVAIWDEFLCKPVATMMALREGRIFCAATYLPDIDVKGDLVVSYLVAANGMDGEHALEIMITPVRPVCRNTLRLARKFASQVYTIRHDALAKQRMGLWMAEAYERAEQKVSVLKEAFNAFAEYKPKMEQVRSIINTAYPMRNPPRNNAPALVVEQRQYQYESNIKRAQTLRNEALDLYENNTLPEISMPGLERTGWKLYNIVSYQGTHNVGRSHEDYLNNLLFGTRGLPTERAFDKIYSIVSAKK